MIVGDLIEQLKEFDENSEVKLVSQPNLPFDYSIEDIVINSDDNFAYLAVKSQKRALPKVIAADIATQLGW